MNKAEFAVCRIKEKLPGNQGFATKGSGCVVHCERLASSWGWKCHYFIVTPSVVLCQDDLASDRVFVAEFLSKDKRGLETFEIKQMADVCTDAVGRRLDNLDLKDFYLTFISVEPLDKRGFLKKMVKKGSLQTFRPLDCFEPENKSAEEIVEGLYCYVITDLFGKSKNSPFSTQTYKLVYDSEKGEFSLQDFGGAVKTFNQEIPPIGAVIFTKKGEFAGILRNFSNKCVTAIFLPEPSITENGEGEDITVSSNGDEACVANNGDLTMPEINLGQENQHGSENKSTNGNNQVEAVSEDVTLPGNSNTLLSSEHISADSEFTNIAPFGAVVEDENDDVNRDVQGEEHYNTDAAQDGNNAIQQLQECPDNLIPGNRTEKIETENLLTSIDSTTEKGGSKFSDKTVESSDAVELGQEKAEVSDEVEESPDKAGKSFEQTEDEAHKAEVVLCKADEGSDTCKIEGSGELEEGFAKVEVDACLEGGIPDKGEEETGVAGKGPCSAEKSLGVMEESPGEAEGGFYEMQKGADRESDSVMGTPCSAVTDETADDVSSNAKIRSTITRHDSSLITVIQVGETSLQTDFTENTELGQHGDSELSISENVPPGSQGMDATEQSNIADHEEQAVACLPDKEDGKMTEPSIDDSAVDQESVASDNTCTESELTELVSVKPEDASETDYVQTPGSDVAIETSAELSQGNEITLVTQDDQELSSISEKTVNTFYDNCDISICITPPIEDVTETGMKDDGSLKEDEHSHEDVHVSENLCQNDPSVNISLSSETSDVEESNINTENEVTGHEDSVDVPLDLEIIEPEDKTEVVNNEVRGYEPDHIVEQYSPKPDSVQMDKDGEAVVTQKEFVEIIQNGSVLAEICENSNHKKSASFEEKAAEFHEDIRETPAVDKPAEKDLSTNVDASDKETTGHDQVTAVDPAVDSLQDEAVSMEVSPGESLEAAVVLQRVDADALLTETVTNNPHILGDLGSCLDTEYQHGRVPCWRDLAELLAVAPEAYEHCATFSETSPTEDLFAFLSATKPHLTIQDIKEALKEIDRLDVTHLLDRKIAGGLISEESVIDSLVERDDTDILGRVALKLDRKKTNNWKHLALKLNVPHRVLRNFGSHQRHNSSLMLLKYIPIFDPELTLDHLKVCLSSIGRQDAVAVLNKAGIPGDEPVKDILDDSDLLDQITDLLNEDPPAPHWRHLAKELKIPQEKCKIFEPTEDNNSPTKLLFKSIENCEPDLTFEELVLALVAMKRQDVLDVLQKYFSSDDIDQILEENNLLAPANYPSADQKES